MGEAWRVDLEGVEPCAVYENGLASSDVACEVNCKAVPPVGRGVVQCGVAIGPRMLGGDPTGIFGQRDFHAAFLQEDLGNIRQRIPTADVVDVTRERERLTIDRELVEWVNEHCNSGGWFRSHGDAAEKSLGRLRVEYNFIERRCRDAGLPFNPTAFYALYKAELAGLPHGPGRPHKGDVRVPPNQVLIQATLASDLVAWASKTWLKTGPVDRLAHVVAVGLRRLRVGGHLLEASEEEPKLTLKPEDFWCAYQKTAQVR